MDLAPDVAKWKTDQRKFEAHQRRAAVEKRLDDLIAERQAKQQGPYSLCLEIRLENSIEFLLCILPKSGSIPKQVSVSKWYLNKFEK